MPLPMVHGAAPSGLCSGHAVTQSLHPAHFGSEDTHCRPRAIVSSTLALLSLSYATLALQQAGAGYRAAALGQAWRLARRESELFGLPTMLAMAVGLALALNVLGDEAFTRLFLFAGLIGLAGSTPALCVHYPDIRNENMSFSLSRGDRSFL